MRRPSRSRVAVATGLSLGTAAAGLLLAPAALAAEALPALSLSASTVAEGGEVTVSGEGCTSNDADDAVEVVTARDVDPETGDVPDLGTDLLGAEVHEDGTWSVTYAFEAGSAGDHTIDAVCLHYDETFEEYPQATVTVTGGSTSTPTPTKSPEAVVDPVKQANTPGTADKSSRTATATPGAKITKVIAGFQPHEVVTLTLHSTPVVLGTFTADAAGVVTATFTLPAGTAAGEHHLVFEGDEGTHFVTALTVAAAAAPVASGSELAYTGADIAVPLVGGIVLVAAGAGAVVVGRRRKTEAAQV